MTEFYDNGDFLTEEISGLKYAYYRKGDSAPEDIFYENCSVFFDEKFCGMKIRIEVEISAHEYDVICFEIEGISDDDEGAFEIYEKVWNWLDNEWKLQLCWDWIEETYLAN